MYMLSASQTLNRNERVQYVLAVQPTTLTSKNVLLKSILAWTCTNSHNYHTISVHKHFDQDQNDEYLKTSRKILSQEMPMCNMKALILII